MTTPQNDATESDSTATGEAESTSAEVVVEELTSDDTASAEGTDAVVDPDRVRSQE
ncbi:MULTISPECIES: hypothetical protein [Streptacidiphilus]|uniref:Uncharacterized protein n=2 Tax=Streptacidiphilus TaxID=228398 RepID=A0ABV6UEG4_9ACTN|nr:hypothetical protein [Streptacidiphilus jeojiense]